MAQLLALPMTEDFYGAHFVTHPSSNTRPGSNVTPVAKPNSYKVPLLVPDPEREIVVLEYQYMGTLGDRDGQLMVISTRRLIDMCHIQRKESITELQRVKIIPWSNWGAMETIWLPFGMIKTSRRVAFGSRLLVVAHMDINAIENGPKLGDGVTFTGPKPRLIVLDFNLRALSRTEGQSSAAGAYVQSLVKEIDRWSPKSPIPWSSDSALKFRATVLEDQGEYLNVYFDGDGFVSRQVCRVLLAAPFHLHHTGGLL